MPSCDTCALLGVPDDPVHAKNYRVCTWQPASWPEPVLHLERIALRSTVGRWVTLAVIRDKPELLPTCSCWEKKSPGEARGKSTSPECR